MYISPIHVPILLTLVMLVLMFRPQDGPDTFGLGMLFRLFWSLPITLVWAVYFAVMYYMEVHSNK